MKKKSQWLFADRLPPLVGGVEMHAGAFIEHFERHPVYPLERIIQSPQEKLPSRETPSVLFFNGGRWIEKMASLRRDYPSALFVYRTGGNEIVKAPLDTHLDSLEKRQAIWISILNKTVDLMITNSEFTEKRLTKLGLRVPFLRCVGGVNPLPKFQSETVPLKGGGPRFFSAARFVPYKNHRLLIPVFNELHKKGFPFSLVLAGDGALLEEAKNLAKENPKITFLGKCENTTVLQEMIHSDVYVQLSSDYKVDVPGGSYIHTEGMGRSILEAISAGVYVVCGRCGALSEIVTQKRGHLVSLDSFSELVTAFENLVCFPPARRSSVDAFGWKKIFERYESFYESAPCN